eukprot:CAMPEP_0185736640 /NCGR_PEP_ID=MMETSP1171-20130828/28412_1 /TAXON_ID=374046 /ORGANISM="Helicotheca tamensis, Strain CCMP826" /LENGTH=394 /DNA_ID=CAMNT_0028407323 /DNA_START=178 /DNA_END=1358 /DNA_ORIENTATION=+
MTFIEPSADPPTTGMIVGYSIVAAAFTGCFFQAVRLGQTRSHYRSFCSIRFLLPLCCLILALETATLAASGYFFGKDVDSNVWIQIVYALQAFEVPILLQSTFETCYLVHKRRSVNFCGMMFDEGKRVKKLQMTTSMKSFVLRNFIRAVSIVLLVMGIIVNFDLIDDVVKVDQLAGRAGWWPLFENDGILWDDKLHLFLSLLPTAILIFCSYYFSLLLWRYGTESSMVVHSSCWNPWFSLFFGTIFLTVGQCFSEKWYPLTSNIGFVLFIISYLHLMNEVDKDMVAASEFVDFLAQVKENGSSSTLGNGSGRIRGGGGRVGTVTINNSNHQDNMQEEGEEFLILSPSIHDTNNQRDDDGNGNMDVESAGHSFDVSRIASSWLNSSANATTMASG